MFEAVFLNIIDTVNLVLARSEDEACTRTMLSARHDPKNEEEKKRLASEHPNEETAIWGNTLLGAIRVTRGRCKTPDLS